MSPNAFECITHVVKIYLSGPIDVAEQVIREYCLHRGLCVTVTPTKFIYTGGEELGYEVGLVHYPRFVRKTVSDIDEQAYELAKLLIEKTFQQSALVVTPTVTRWFSTRDI